MHHDKQGKPQDDPRQMNQQGNRVGSERNEEETGKPVELNKDKDKDNMGQQRPGQGSPQQGGQHQGGQGGGQHQGGQHQGGQGGQQHGGQRNP